MRVLALALLLSHFAFAGENASVFTDLATECKPVGDPDATWGELPRRCPGVGNYFAKLTFDGPLTTVTVEHTDGIFDVKIGTMRGVPGKLEWRTSNQIPFAVIFKMQSVITIVGLKDLPKLRKELPARIEMHVTAREYADDVFRKR